MEADDLLDLALSALGIGVISQYVVQKGNDVVILNIRSRTALRARPGDRVKVAGGGYVEKLAAVSWVQWRYYGPDDPDAVPPTGRELLSTPARWLEPHPLGHRDTPVSEP